MHLRLCTHHLHPVFLPGLCVFRLLLSLYNFAFLHGQIVGIDEDVVQIDNNTYIEQIAEHIVHEALKSSRGIR